MRKQDSRLGKALSTVLRFAAIAITGSHVASSGRAQSSGALANDQAILAAAAAESGKTIVWGGNLVVSTASTVNDAEPRSYSGAYVGTLTALHAKSAISSALKLSYSQEYSYERDDGSAGGRENPVLLVSRPWLSGKDFDSKLVDSLTLSVSGSLGADNESRRRTFLWSNGISGSASKSVGRLLLSQGFGYTRSFFEYDIRANGVVNSPDTVRSVSKVVLNIDDRFSIGGSFTFAYGISFQGVGRTTQLSEFSADYAFTDKIFGSIGAATERGTLEPDGASNRVRFFAPEAAHVFFDLMITL